MGEIILQVNHLSKTFGKNEVLRDIDFTVNKGDVTSIIGASGSGKSTLLRCINLLETPTTGEVLFHGKNVAARGMAAYAYHARVLGYRDETVDRFFCEGLFAVGEELTMAELLPLTLKVGEVNLRCMDCRLIALDLDGTLLNREKQIPPENLAALEKAHRAGIVLVPASGRSRAGIPDCVKAAPYFRYFITSNGASVWDRARGEEIWSAPIAPELALRALAALGEMDGETDVYADGGGLIGAASLKRLAEFPMPARQLAYIRATRRPVASLRDAVAAARSVELMGVSPFGNWLPTREGKAL